LINLKYEVKSAQYMYYTTLEKSTNEIVEIEGKSEQMQLSEQFLTIITFFQRSKQKHDIYFSLEQGRLNIKNHMSMHRKNGFNFLGL
jgi:hypothetical protein